MDRNIYENKCFYGDMAISNKFADKIQVLLCPADAY